MKVNLIKTSTGYLKPATDEDREKLRKFKRDVVLEVNIKIFRNYGFHQKYFSLLKMIAENLKEGINDAYLDKDVLRREVMLQIGEYEVHRTMGGSEQLIPKSISFEKLSQEDFESIYQRTIDFAIKHLVDFTEEDIRNEIVNFI